MATLYSPKIVTDGLVLCLDAGNPKSYPGSGTVWNDLSGNSNTGTLVNTPTFNSASSGNIIFNGSNNYTTFGGITVNTNTGFTLDLWMYVDDPQPVYNNFWSYVYVVNSMEWGTYAAGGSQGVLIFKDNGASGSPSVNTTYIGNQWANVTFICNGTIPSIYTNGSFTQTNTSFRNINLTISELFRGDGGNGMTYYKTRIGSLKIYTRALTATEVLQNFNATRSRFGV